MDLHPSSSAAAHPGPRQTQSTAAPGPLAEVATWREKPGGQQHAAVQGEPARCGTEHHRRWFRGPLEPCPSGARPPGTGQAYSAAPPQQIRAQPLSLPPATAARPKLPGPSRQPSCPVRVIGLPRHPDPYQLPVRDEPSLSPAQNSASHKPLWLPTARLPGRAESSAPPAGRRPFPTGKGGTCRRPGTEIAEPAFA